MTKAGRYDLREELGRGAMGVVYRGFDPVIGRAVAVKTLHLSEAGTGLSREELVGRFQTEARAAGLLTHPNIVVVFDAGEEEGLFYITMEFVEGRSLQSHMDTHQPFAVPRVLKLMEQVCSALDYAHQHNVVHRDIKPANLMLTADDIVKITDFGTAKILQFGTAQTAHVMGTPSYMSPEQVKGKPVDGRSDIFSLGVILYELMTGEKPFPGQNITTVIYKIVNEEPISPRSLDSSIHPGLSAVITRALAKDPAARYQSCQELLNGLKNYHEMTNADATVRMAPAASLPAAAGNRPSAQAPRMAPVPVIPAAPEADLGARFTLPVAVEEEPAKRPGSLILTLVLLAIIGYAGYRVYAPAKDLWSRAHDAVRTPAIPAKPEPGSQTPNAENAAAKPESQSTEAPSAAAPAAPAADTAEENSVPRDTPQAKTVAATPAKPVELAPATATEVDKSPTPQKPALPPGLSPAHLFESKLRAELAGQPIADKVKIQAAGSVLTLSGSLTFAEHRELLDHLRAVPSAVRVIDDIEYSQDQKASSPSASAGWIWVRSNPAGARILVDGTETGLRTPARMELQVGQHELQLVRRGFGSISRTVSVHAGETSQFSEFLPIQ
jgi:predicted Ser/Thr protein kinase